MKRSLLAVIAISAMALVACEPQDTAVDEMPAADETQDVPMDTAAPMQPDTAPMGMTDTAVTDTATMDTPEM